MRLRTIIPFAAATVLACPGVIVGGRRIIYVNGFHKTQVAETRTFLTEHRNDSAALRNFPSAFRDSDYWRGVATMVCDGGEYYFGVEYVYSSARIFRSDRGTASKYGLSALISLGAALAFFVAALVVQLLIGPRAKA